MPRPRRGRWVAVPFAQHGMAWVYRSSGLFKDADGNHAPPPGSQGSKYVGGLRAVPAGTRRGFFLVMRVMRVMLVLAVPA